MAIRKNDTKAPEAEELETITIDDDGSTTNSTSKAAEVVFVDQLPEVKRGGGPGRQVTEQTKQLIATLTANPGKYAHLGTKRSSQPNPTLRRAGILEKFRRNEDGTYDRFAAYVGTDAMPKRTTKGQ